MCNPVGDFMPCCWYLPKCWAKKKLNNHLRILMEATPAKWNVFSVICVPGSPILWAHRAPTAVLGSIFALEYFSLHRFRKCFSWDLVQRFTHENTKRMKWNTELVNEKKNNNNNNTRPHLYQRIDEHKRSGSIFNHSQGQHPSRTITSNMFHILKKCSGKFDCLLYEMFLIREHKPCLNIQSDSIKAKLFT